MNKSPTPRIGCHVFSHSALAPMNFNVCHIHMMEEARLLWSMMVNAHIKSGSKISPTLLKSASITTMILSPIGSLGVSLVTLTWNHMAAVTHCSITTIACSSLIMSLMKPGVVGISSPTRMLNLRISVPKN